MKCLQYMVIVREFNHHKEDDEDVDTSVADYDKIVHYQPIGHQTYVTEY